MATEELTGSAPLPFSLREDDGVDASVWFSAISGLVGTAVGGGLSIWASVVAQQHQATSARALVVAGRVDSAADAAIQKFFQVKQHVRGRPSPAEPNFQNRMAIWRKALQQQTSKLEPLLLQIREPDFRLRLTRVTAFLAGEEMTEPGLGGSFGLLELLCDHALDCLGSFVRDEPLPPENHWMGVARQVEADYQEAMEDMAMDYEQGYH